MRILLTISLLAFLGAQSQSRPPVRTLGAATVASEHGATSVSVRELARGRVLVNDSRRRQIYILDTSLSRAGTVFDSAPGTATSYPQGARFIPYGADSTFILDGSTQGLLLYDPDGQFVRVTASPLGRESYRLGNTGTVASDGHGRVVYQIPPSPQFMAPCGDGPSKAPAPSPADSVNLIARANFDTRAVDTVARGATTAFGLPIVKDGADCKAVSARMMLMPVAKPVDEWTVTSLGSIAIVRGGTYAIDWIDPDGSHRSTPRMPFDWRRITDDEKQAKIDSARRITDSVASAGGYQARACRGNGGYSLSTLIDAPKPPPPGAPPSSGSGGGRSGAGVAGGGDGLGGGQICVMVPIARDFPPLSDIPDYLPAVRRGGVLADRDDNVWILPTTSLEAKNGLLYDVVNKKGELFERVQLPADRAIAGFGKGGVVYLNWRDAGGVWNLERRAIQR